MKTNLKKFLIVTLSFLGISQSSFAIELQIKSRISKDKPPATIAKGRVTSITTSPNSTSDHPAFILTAEQMNNSKHYFYLQCSVDEKAMDHLLGMKAKDLFMLTMQALVAENNESNTSLYISCYSQNIKKSTGQYVSTQAEKIDLFGNTGPALNANAITFYPELDKVAQ